MSPRRILGIIVLVPAVLTSATGCHVVGIPGYRLDQDAICQCSGSGFDAHSGQVIGEYSGSSIASQSGPKWLAKWRTQQNLPEPPATPRFLPLPTKPMFSGQSELEEQAVVSTNHYGQLPPSESWTAPLTNN